MEARYPTRSTLAGAEIGARGRGREIVYFSLLAALGALGILFARAAAGVFAVLVALGLVWWITARLKRMGLEVWQALLLLTLSGYLLLNYGFENIALHVGGVPLIISYALMYLCLALAMFTSMRTMPAVLTEPTILIFFGLLFISVLHLVTDLPSYGLWAIRDSTMILDGIFLVLGMLWATRKQSTTVLIKWLMVLTVINAFYSFTFPWSAKVLAWSPTSGVFQDVPIIGQYHTTDIYLLLGTVLCLGLGSYMFPRRRWLMLGLVVAQMLGLAIIQARASYVALAAFVVILTFIGETKKSKVLVGLLASALVVLVLVTSVGGVQLSGRIGPVNIEFLVDHLRSITGAKVTAASTVQSRFDWSDEAMERFRSSPVVGVGFGQALINYIDEETGAVVRFPHNSNMSILARLGVIGFVVWLVFHLSLLKRFVHAYRHRKRMDRQLYELILWLFLFYVTFMITALVEAPFEFPSSAIPFYFFMGLALAQIRWHIPHPMPVTTEQKQVESSFSLS